MTVEDACFRALRRKTFPRGRYVLLQGVGETTGMAGRRADGIAMACWPSDGFVLHGLEVKASRADWLRELRQPDKAQQVARYCDHWWIVTPDPAIIRDGEIPDPWGLLRVDFGLKRVVRVKPAAALNPLPISRQFLAALLRAARPIKEDP